MSAVRQHSPKRIIDSVRRSSGDGRLRAMVSVCACVVLLLAGAWTLSAQTFAMPDSEPSVEYDPQTGLYFFRSKLGDDDVVTPLSMSQDEYMTWSEKEAMRNYWKERNRQEAENEKNKKISLNDIQFGLGKADKIFGPGGVRLKLQGQVEILMGFKINRVQNPALSERMRKPAPIFDFDEKIQMNVDARVGDRVHFGMNYNTESSFDWDQSKVNLSYEGKEDDIIRRIEAGNVSLPLNSSLIRGSSALFGIRSDLQFGKLSVQAVVSQQESESKTVSMRNGAQTTDFEVKGRDYDVNRHFFLNHYFRDNYEKWMSSLPHISSGMQINRVEVWVTNKKSDYSSSRNIVAFLDLGETDHRHAPWGVALGVKWPSNKSNGLYGEVTSLPNLRDIETVSAALNSTSVSMTGGEDYEKLESARRLNESEYTVNPMLGYISLKSKLQDDEVLAVAYEYTSGGKTYQVGEFSTDGIEEPKTLVLKLLKGAAFSPGLPNWDLMMKNIYSLGASNVQQEGMKLEVAYQNDSSGVYINYLPEGDVKNQPLVRVMGLDRMDSRQRLRPDGNMDYVEGYTILSETGRLIFPVLEPFGKTIEEKAGSAGSKYAYKELYTKTKTDAEEYSEKDKFIIRGEYRASSNAEIRLGAMNIPKGSVSVTAGGMTLTENVDYTVDYSMGTVTILNESLLESGTQIDVSLENQSMFSMQRKTLIGTHMEYAFSKDFSVGGTLMHLSEKPLTTKVAMGDEPISNTIWGLNFAYTHQSQQLTNWLDKLPLLSLKAPSSFTINGEFAQLLPGHQKAVGDAGYAYIDDFEGSRTTLNVLYPYAWHLASTPQGRFAAGNLSDDIEYGKGRALLAWYTIDPIFTRSTSTTPSYIQRDDKQQSSHWVREISEQEIFPNREPIAGQTNTLTVLNLAYYPTERGPYNLDTDNINADGSLRKPSSRWGGIMRKMDVTDFKSANVEYVEFWLLDPFIYNPQASGGDLYINLGELSEDVLRDGKKSFENGLSPTGDITYTDSTVWGRVSKTQSVVNAFDNDKSARMNQDIGLDGLRNEEEFTFKTYKDYLSTWETKIGAQYVDSLRNDPFSPFNDPAGDRYHYYQGDDYNAAQTSILDRYKHYNGTEGNSPVSAGADNYSTSATNLPDVEDINQDNNMNEYEKYFEYKVSLRPADMVVGRNFISDKLNVRVGLKDGTTSMVSWYHFRIPVSEYSEKYGSVNLNSIRFMRMYLTDFTEETHLRFGSLELARSDWRTVSKDLYDPAYPPITASTQTEISVVNIEENSSKTPVNYVLPPGVEREQDPSQTQIRQENEQSLMMRITDLSPGDARAVYKTTEMDMRPYKRLQFYAHAEKFIDDVTDLKGSDLTYFVRLGSDLVENYYEYEVPLTLTPAGTYSLSESSSDREIVWPRENKMDFPFSVLTDVKKNRNRARRQSGSGVSLKDEYSEYDPNAPRNKVTVKGNPTLGDIENIMIGVRNRSSSVKSAEIWLNELRMKGFDEEGGYAALANATLNLSDFASVNVAGRVETAGFGGIEDNVQDRRQDDYTQLNISTSAELGKLFPEKAKVHIPVYYAYGKEVTKPKYDPTNTDLLLKESLETLETSHEKDSLENLAQTVFTTRSFNVTNMRVDLKSKNPMPYDPANFSVSYSYTESNEHNPDVERSIRKDYKGTLLYQYAPSVKTWEPFKNVKALKGQNWRIVRELGFNLVPSSVNFNTSLARAYEEEQQRNLNNPEIDYHDPNNALLSVSKDFMWNRSLDVKWDLIKDLKLSFSATSNAQIDETKYSPVNKELFPDEWDNWRDTVMRSLLNGGSPLSYQQHVTANYTSPLNKIPIFSWITSSLNYTGNYTWDRGALTEEDEAAGRHNSSLGNEVTSLGTLQWDGRFNFEQLYNKVPYLKRANQRYSSRGKTNKKKTEEKPLVKTQKMTLKKGQKKKFSHRLNTTRVKVTAMTSDSQSVKLKYDVLDRNTVEIIPQQDAELIVSVDGKNMNAQPEGMGAVVQGAARFLMMVRNASFSYTQSNGTSMSGFMPAGGLFGQDDGAPGALFSLGYQEPGFVRNAWEKGWLCRDSTVGAVNKTYTQDLTLRMSLEPVSGFRIDLAASRNYATNTSIQYQYAGMPRTFSGSFSMTTIALKSLFTSTGNVSNNYHSPTFERFKANRAKYQSRLERKYIGTRYPAGSFMAENSEALALVGREFDPSVATFSANSAEVLIPSFMEAYTGRSWNESEIIPGFLSMLPNWRVSYDGLSKLPWMKDHFKRIALTHAYVCKYNIGSFASYSNFIGMDGDFGYVADVTTGMPIPSSQYDIAAVSITENFSPLIRLDATLKNSLTLTAEYRKGRTQTLNIAAGQMVESGNKEIVFGVGYRLSDFDVILRLKNDKEQKVNNDLNLRLDFSMKNTSALIRKLDDESIPQVTSGEKTYSVNFSADYVFSSRLNLKLYYDWESNEPLISSSYPTSNHNFGLSVKLLLNNQ